MFDRIKTYIALCAETAQLRRELAIVRHNRDLLQNENAVLLLDKQNAKKRDKMHEDERSRLIAQIEQLNDQVIQREKDTLEAQEQLKRQKHENELLREQMEPLSCEGCIHTANYRKCASCARYPKIRDKYETEESI